MHSDSQDSGNAGQVVPQHGRAVFPVDTALRRADRGRLLQRRALRVRAQNKVEKVGWVLYGAFGGGHR